MYTKGPSSSRMFRGQTCGMGLLLLKFARRLAVSLAARALILEEHLKERIMKNQILVLIVGLFSSAFLGASAGSASCQRLLDGGPWAWWTLNEPNGSQLFDQSGNNNTASVSPNAPPSIQTAKVHSGYAFNGVDQYVETPNSLSLSFGTGSFSIMAWVQPGAQQRSVFTIVDKRQQSPSLVGYSFFLYDGRIGVQLATGAGGSGFADYITAEKMPLDQNWHLVAVSVDRTKPDGIRFYLDGAQLGVPFNPLNQPGSLDSIAALRIGSVAFSVESVFYGFLDEVMLFPRALSALEVKTVRRADASGLCSQCISVVNDQQQYQSLTADLTHLFDEFASDGSATPIPPITQSLILPGNYFLNQNRVTFESVGVSTQRYPFGSLSPFLGQKLGYIEYQFSSVHTIASYAGVSNGVGSDAIQANMSTPVRAIGFYVVSADPSQRFIIHRIDANGSSINTYPVSGNHTPSFFSLVSSSRCRDRIQSARMSPQSGFPFSSNSWFGTYKWRMLNYRYAY